MNTNPNDLSGNRAIVCEVFLRMLAGRFHDNETIGLVLKTGCDYAMSDAPARTVVDNNLSGTSMYAASVLGSHLGVDGKDDNGISHNDLFRERLVVALVGIMADTYVAAKKHLSGMGNLPV